MIAKALAKGDPKTKPGDNRSPQRGIWERYAYHFQSENTRRKFFAGIDLIAKRNVAQTVFCQARSALHCSKMEVPELLWDEALLPRSTAPQVLRQWISDTARTRRFLTTLFQHYANLHRKGSMIRRTVIAAKTADKFGWKSLKITEALAKAGDINLGQHPQRAKKTYLRYAAGAVGRSVHRMRKADEDRRAKMNAERRRQRAIDRAAVKRARLLKIARASLIRCLARRIDWTNSASSKPSVPHSGVVIAMRPFGDRGAVLAFK